MNIESKTLLSKISVLRGKKEFVVDTVVTYDLIDIYTIIGGTSDMKFTIPNFQLSLSVPLEDYKKLEWNLIYEELQNYSTESKMNKATEAIIDLFKQHVKMKLLSISITNGTVTINATTYNDMPKIIEAVKESESIDKKTMLKNPNYYFTNFPLQTSISFEVPERVYDTINWNLVNSTLGYDTLGSNLHIDKKCVCSKEQVLYKGCICRGS